MTMTAVASLAPHLYRLKKFSQSRFLHALPRSSWGTRQPVLSLELARGKIIVFSNELLLGAKERCRTKIENWWALIVRLEPLAAAEYSAPSLRHLP